MGKITKLVLASQTVLLLFIAVCVIITPHFLFSRNEGGMSNYGVHASTVVFYTLAFTISSALLFLAARSLPKTPDYRSLRRIFIITAYSLLLVLVTTYPYKHSNTYNNIHTAGNIWTFCFQMYAGIWLALFFQRDIISILLLLVQLLAFVLIVLTFVGAIHLLFVAQILTMLAYGLLLVVSTTKLPET